MVEGQDKFYSLRSFLFGNLIKFGVSMNEYTELEIRCSHYKDTESRKSEGGEGGVLNCWSSEKSNNTSIKAEQSDLRWTKYCHCTRP